MKIAITGASGTVGKEVVKLCADKGYHTVQIDRIDTENDANIPNTEMRTADAATSFEDLREAFRGCDAVIHLAAIPNPVDKDDSVVHSNNVNTSFNGFRACAELRIKKICYASSVNAIGLAYANRPLHFDYFPVDEKYPQRPSDSYALSKQEAEIQARSFAFWHPGTKIACLRIHEVAPRADVKKEHSENWDGAGVKQLWGWVHPQATARACLLAIEKSDAFDGCEIFNIHAPDTAQDIPSKELAQKYYPNAELKSGWGEKNDSFFTTDKAQNILGWEHHEKE